MSYCNGFIILLTFTCLLYAAAALESAAFYYGESVPVNRLSKFDIVVVDPSSNLNPAKVTGHAKYFAYVSLGEVSPNRDYYKDIPESWIMGPNGVWGSQVINLTIPEYTDFFATQVVGRQWDRGFRGFFLDTMDSYQLFAKTAEAQAEQRAGMINVIQAIKTHYPNASIIYNRGFDIITQTHTLVYAVAFESLYKSWNNAAQTYVDVPASDRSWLLAQVKNIETLKPAIPIISIEYCPPTPANNACQREAIKQVKAQHLIPYVADGLLKTVGRSS